MKLHSVFAALVVSVTVVLPPGCDDAEPSGSADDGLLPEGGDGKADDGSELSILGEDFTTRIGELPVTIDERSPMRDSDSLPDLTRAAELYDETFETNGVMAQWLRDSGMTEDDVFRAAMFVSAHETEVRDDEATINGVQWDADDLRAAYALAWLEADESLRVPVGDGEEDLNAALFHIVFTQLLAQGNTVVSGRSDGAGAVYDGFEIQGRRSGAERPVGPEKISRDTAEAILRQDVVDAAAYHFVFASITTTRGFASESYVLATNEDEEIIAGWWTPPNDAFPPIRPSRLWIAPQRPKASGPMSFEKLDAVRDAFNGEVPVAIGDTYEFVGEPVAFTENKFFCAEVAMRIEDRFQVGDITVRADFSPVEGEDWDHELQVRLAHSPPGNGLSLSRLAGDESDLPEHTERSGEWKTSDFNFEGSDSASSPWELRVCDMSRSSGDRDLVTGFVNSFSIEFHAP